MRGKKGWIQERDKVVHPLLPVVSAYSRQLGRGLKKEMRKTDERRKDIRHLRGKTEWLEWYLNQRLSVKPAGNCVSIKRFSDATPYTSNYQGNPPGGFARRAAHSISIGRLPRGYLYSTGSNFPSLAHHATSFVLRLKHMADLKINERLQLHCASHTRYMGIFPEGI